MVLEMNFTRCATSVESFLTDFLGLTKDSATCKYISGDHPWMLRGTRAERLGTVTAPDADAAIARAIDEFGITDLERQKRVAVSPMQR
jgi:hypothetical protein